MTNSIVVKLNLPVTFNNTLSKQEGAIVKQELRYTFKPFNKVKTHYINIYTKQTL